MYFCLIQTRCASESNMLCRFACSSPWWRRAAQMRCSWRVCCSPVWSRVASALCRAYWRSRTPAWRDAAATSWPLASSCSGGDISTLCTSSSNSWWLVFWNIHQNQTTGPGLKKEFCFTGSCARSHDLHSVLHTRSHFLRPAGRAAGLSCSFIPQFCHQSVIFPINFPCLFDWAEPAPDLTQRWLVRAKEHLRTYLQEQQGRSSGRKKSQVNTFRKMMSSSDVSRLLIYISHFKEMPKH